MRREVYISNNRGFRKEIENKKLEIAMNDVSMTPCHYFQILVFF